MYSLIVLQIKKPLLIFDDSINSTNFVYLTVKQKMKDEKRGESYKYLKKLEELSNINNPSPFEDKISVERHNKIYTRSEHDEWIASNSLIVRRLKAKEPESLVMSYKLFNYDEKVSDLDRMLNLVQNKKNLIKNAKEFLTLAFKYFTNNNLELINLDYMYDDLLNDAFYEFLACLNKFLSLHSQKIFLNYESVNKINRFHRHSKPYEKLMSPIFDEALGFSSDEYIKNYYSEKFDTLISHLVALKKNCGIIESGIIFWPDGQITDINNEEDELKEDTDDEPNEELKEDTDDEQNEELTEDTDDEQNEELREDTDEELKEDTYDEPNEELKEDTDDEPNEEPNEELKEDTSDESDK
jgi:hypothetical protein